MDLNLNKYDKIISLGTTCTFSFMFTLKNFHRSVFDTSIVAPMWGICQLISNNFDGFLSNMVYDKLYDGANGSGIYDKKYFMRTFGNNPRAPDYMGFCKIMQDKGDEFMELLKTAKGNILFLRHAEMQSHKYYGTRLPNVEFDVYYSKPEIEYVKQFSNIIKTINPNLKFKILFMSPDEDCFVDEEHNIIGIPDNEAAEFMNKDLKTIMNNHFNTYCSFMSQHLS
jgi:hypothetical protein